MGFNGFSSPPRLADGKLLVDPSGSGNALVRKRMNHLRQKPVTARADI
jgi:hypothetical protein